MFKEIRDLRPMSLSVLIMTLIASWMLTLSLGITIVGAQASDTEAGEQFSSLGGLQIALTCISIFMCLPSVVKLAIRRDSRRSALWQVIGASPASAKARYTGIASISALVGAVLGGIFAYLTWPSFTDLVKNTGLLALPSLSDPLTVWAWTFGPGTAFLVLLLSLVLGTRSITRIEPVVALSEAPEKAPANSVTKIIFSVLIVAGIIVGYIAIGKTHPIGQAQPIYDSEKLSGIVSAYWGTGLGLLLAYGLSDRIIIQPVVRLIGAILPLNFLDSWLLAETSARRRSVVSTSVITPLVVAASAVGCIFGMVNQTKNVTIALGASEADLQVSPTSQIILVFGAPVIVAAFAGVLAVYLTNEWRKHDIALLQTLGATTTSIRWAAVFECLIYFAAAVVISTVILGINALAMGTALHNGPVPGASPVWIGNETYYLLAVGFALLAITIVIPTLRESHTLRLTAIVR